MLLGVANDWPATSGRECRGLRLFPASPVAACESPNFIETTYVFSTSQNVARLFA